MMKIHTMTERMDYIYYVQELIFFVYIVYYISHYFYTGKQITKLLHGLVDVAPVREMQNAAKTIRKYPVTRAAEEAKVTEVTAIQCYQYLLRDICSWRLSNVDMPHCFLEGKT